jgi:hypothetical protein
MVKDCKKCTNGGFGMLHAFYVGMLGLRYNTQEGEKVIWPNQFCWLLQQNLLQWQDHASWGLSREVILDKSNADRTVKLFALLQVSWFVAQSIMRVAHDLPLSQLEAMTLSYIPLYAVTYFFWWTKPKDVLLPSKLNLPDFSLDQKSIFEQMAIDTAFDHEDKRTNTSLTIALKLTPRMFEKEARDKAEAEDAVTETRSGTLFGLEDGVRATPGDGSEEKVSRDMASIDESVVAVPRAQTLDHGDAIQPALKSRHTIHVSRQAQPELARLHRRTMTSQVLEEEKSDVRHIESSFAGRVLHRATTGFWTAQSRIGTSASAGKDRIIPLRSNERVVSYWDPDLYHSKIWPLTCLFGISFPALHLIGWHTAFPTLVELWLWRASALASIASMLIFMHYEKVVLKWGGPLVLLSLISPVVYFITRVIMIAQAFASFRAMDIKVYDTYEVSTYWIHLL